MACCAKTLPVCYNLGRPLSITLHCSIFQLPPLFHSMRTVLMALLLCCGSTGCAVVAVAGAAVTVVATTVKVGAAAAGAVVDVGAAGVRAATGHSEN